MRKVILLMHMSLDGYVGGPNGELDWISLDEEIWDYVSAITDTADTALYGEKTYRLMEDYWPTAADEPDASRHDKEHGEWVNSARKLVFSTTRQSTNWANTRIVRADVAGAIAELKAGAGKNLLMFGSPTLAQYFMRSGLLDELYLTVNPVILGGGKPLFRSDGARLPLELKASKAFTSGVVGLHYAITRR